MTTFPTGKNILPCRVLVTPPWPKPAFSQSVGIQIPGPIQRLLFPQNSLPVQCLAGKEVTTLRAERESTTSTNKAASPKRVLKSTSKCLLGSWHSSNKPGVRLEKIKIIETNHDFPGSLWLDKTSRIIEFNHDLEVLNCCGSQGEQQLAGILAISKMLPDLQATFLLGNINN